MARFAQLLLCCLVYFSLVSDVFSDTPANCTYEDVRGKWQFMIGQGGFNNTIDCSVLGESNCLTSEAGTCKFQVQLQSKRGGTVTVAES